MQDLGAATHFWEGGHVTPAQGLLAGGNREVGKLEKEGL